MGVPFTAKSLDVDVEDDIMTAAVNRRHLTGSTETETFWSLTEILVSSPKKIIKVVFERLLLLTTTTASRRA